ncbi:protein-tyrosine phosphatase-like protein [Mycena capillaripes]|nr:protein-tyrosine phosphatase-like protein [Mycena capillaripes]
MVSGAFSVDVDEILKDQIYLGNLWAAQSEETKEKNGITHILSVCPEATSSDAKHLVVSVFDSEYEDLLIHLPETCRFIENALAEGGRVLIHCVMGVSRSSTVLTAYLMQTRSLTPAAAISFIRRYRPQIQPNYGFLKQLDTFLECGYAPSVTHPAYVSWKRKQKQDVTNFLNHLIDCTAIIPDTLLLSSEFPSEPDQAELLLVDLNITHVLSLAPAEVISVPNVRHHHIDVSPDTPDELLLVLPDACKFVRDAVAGGGTVLVHSLLEARACTVVGAYLMVSRSISPEVATGVIQKALPLFDPTSNFTRALGLFAACKHKPTSGHPAIAAHKACVSWDSALTSRPSASALELQSEVVHSADLLKRTAAAVMSESAIDMSAFGDALVAIQQKASMGKLTSVTA